MSVKSIKSKIFDITVIIYVVTDVKPRTKIAISCMIKRLSLKKEVFNFEILKRFISVKTEILHSFKR